MSALPPSERRPPADDQQAPIPTTPPEPWEVVPEGSGSPAPEPAELPAPAPDAPAEDEEAGEPASERRNEEDVIAKLLAWRPSFDRGAWDAAVAWVEANPGTSAAIALAVLWTAYRLVHLSVDRARLLEMLERERELLKAAEAARDRALIEAAIAREEVTREALAAAQARTDAEGKDLATGLIGSALLGGVWLLGKMLLG